MPPTSAVLASLALPLALAASTPSPSEEGLAERLWQAVVEGDAATVHTLLDRGLDPDVKFRDSGTALMYAVLRDRPEIVETLLEHGADVHVRDRLNNMTILHFSAGQPAALSVVLAHGAAADVNERDTLEGRSPIGWAVFARCRECVDQLLATGRANRWTLREALDLAERSQQPEIAGALKAALGRTAYVSTWSQFRGNLGLGIADGEEAPAAWNGAEPGGVLWKTPIPGLGHSSPIVWGDRVFVTSAVSSQPETDFYFGGVTSQAKDRSPHRWRLSCLDKETGKVIWERTAHEGVPEVGRSPNNSYASETPATDGEHVAAYFGSHGLHVFDFAGNLRWQTDFGLVEAGWFFDASVTWGSASSPIIYRDLVIVQVDRQKESFIAAFDVETGERRWLARRDELPSWGTPGIYLGPDHAELVTNGIEQIRGYDPSTGELLWHLKTGNSHVSAPSPVSGLGLIIVANGHRPLKPVYAIRPGARGDISLAPEATANGAIAWSSKSAGPYYVTPLIYGERLYILTEQGVLAAYYLKTGEQIYRQRVGGGAVRFSASPVAADGKIYLTDENCDVYVVRDGIEFELLGKNPLGEPTCMATPAISEGRMLFRTRHHLVAVGERRAAASPTAAAATGDDQ